MTPPPQMPATMEAGTIHGYCVGEPWNQQAVFKGIGVPVITDYEIWKNNPEKVFGMTAEFVEENPNTALAVTKALIRAAIWLDENDNANRMEAVEMLSPARICGRGCRGHRQLHDRARSSMRRATCARCPTSTSSSATTRPIPFYSDAIWYLTQMRRWGQIAEPQSDAWYFEIAESVYRPDVYLQAARLVVDDGLADEADFPWDTDGYKAPTPAEDIIDGIAYDGRTPNAYLESLTIGLKGEQVVVGTEIQADAGAARASAPRSPRLLQEMHAMTAVDPDIIEAQPPGGPPRRLVYPHQQRRRLATVCWALAGCTPLMSVAAGDNPCAQAREIWRLLGVPLLAIAAFLTMWACWPRRCRPRSARSPAPRRSGSRSCVLHNDAQPEGRETRASTTGWTRATSAGSRTARRPIAARLYRRADLLRPDLHEHRARCSSAF